MMYFMRRDWLMERLRLGLRQSYRIVGNSRSGLVSLHEIIGLLNRARRGIKDPYSFVPSDLLTAEELIAIPELAASGLTSSKIRAWTRRTRNIPPHFRLNGHTIRYPQGLFLDWLAKNSKVENRS